MKIDDAKADGLKGLVHRQRNLVAAKEREIENVRNFYDAKKESDRISGHKELIEVQDNSQKEILAAVENKSSRLATAREGLQKDLTRLENERALLAQKESFDQEASIAEGRLQQQIIAEQSLEKAKEIGQTANSKIADLQKESQWQIAQASAQARNKYDDNIKTHESVLGDKLREQRLQLTFKDIEHNKKLNQARSEFEKDLNQATRSNVGDRSQREQQHIKELKTAEDQYNYILREKRKQFEQKFTHLEKEHNEIVQRTEERFRKQLDSLSSEYASTRQVAQTRKEDPFYHLKSLDHQIEETPEAYLVKIKVPEFEADNIILSAHNRTVKLAMNRRFSERLDGEQGRVNINKRSESFTQEFPVDKIVDSRSVSRKYEDGVLSFKILKA